MHEKSVELGIERREAYTCVITRRGGETICVVAAEGGNLDYIPVLVLDAALSPRKIYFRTQTAFRESGGDEHIGVCEAGVKKSF